MRKITGAILMLAASVYALAHIVAQTGHFHIFGVTSGGFNGPSTVLGFLMIIHFVLGLYFLCTKEKEKPKE